MDATEQKERVAALTDRGFRDHMVDELRTGAEQFTELRQMIADNNVATHKALEENTALTKQNIAATSGLVGIFNGAAMGVNAFAWTGRTLRKIWKILQPIVVLLVFAWVAMGGKWPSWLKPPGG